VTAITSPVELLAELARKQARISTTDDGRVAINTDGTPEEVRRACRHWKWVLVWGLYGAERGYSWHGCDSCGELTSLAKKHNRPCGMTHGCRGRSRLIPSPKFLPGAAPAMSKSLDGSGSRVEGVDIPLTGWARLGVFGACLDQQSRD
jgi:hypothetical protein